MDFDARREVVSEATKYRTQGRYSLAAKRYMSAAYSQFAGAYEEEPDFMRFAHGMEDTIYAIFSARFAGETARAETYARHGLLVLQEGRDYEFEKNPFGFRGADAAYTGISYEWEGHLRTAAGLDGGADAYGEAKHHYAELTATISIGSRLGWEGEPEFAQSRSVAYRIMDDADYPNTEQLHDDLMGFCFVERITLLREHFPRAVVRLLNQESWHADSTNE